VYIIDYKKKEHHRHSHEKKKQQPIDESKDPKGSLTKKQKAALEKLEQISNNALEDSQKATIEALAAATTKFLSDTKPTTTTESTGSDKVIPPDSAEIDLENEPIEKKRERQRSLVLNLGKKKNKQFELNE
jgi:hypothetical protein